MAAKNDNLPVDVDIDLHNGGTIKYASEVIAIIAGVAASEVDGIAGMVTSGGFGDIISRNRNITRGIKVEMGGEEVAVDIYAIVEYGQPIQKVALEVQENVRKAIESMTGLHVVKVDVHVQGVSFEKENKDRAAAIEATRIPAIEDSRPEKKKQSKAKAARQADEAPKQEQETADEEKAAEEPEKDPTEEAAQAPEAPEEQPANAEPKEEQKRRPRRKA
jgi:uncharacterized alkaline shock family protein YloU